MSKQDLIDKINQVHYENINRGYEYLNRMWENDMFFVSIIVTLAAAISLAVPLYLHSDSNAKSNERFNKLESKLDSLIKQTSDSNSP